MEAIPRAAAARYWSHVEPPSPRVMRLQFLGAATTVTGSQFLLTTERARWAERREAAEEEWLAASEAYESAAAETLQFERLEIETEGDSDLEFRAGQVTLDVFDPSSIGEPFAPSPAVVTR